jgi:hypothetical protein
VHKPLALCLNRIVPHCWHCENFLDHFGVIFCTHLSQHEGAQKHQQRKK